MKIKTTSIYVDNQDKALRFYTEVLGMAKKADFSNGPYRWLTVGSAEYKDCVAKMTGADKATGGTMGQNNGSNSAQATQMRANADAQRKQMQADMARQRAQMQAQMNQQMQDAKSNPKCKTVTSGTNTVTQCP